MRNPDTHIAIFGHAKHGKSTLAGRLLYEFGGIDEKSLRKLEKEAKALGKDFNRFNLAFLKRRSETHEKGSGKSDDQSRTEFPDRGNIKVGEDRIVSLIDTPGHERFLPQIIYGAFLSDLAILIVESLKGVEQGTRDIAGILKSFGIRIIAIVVTKMDRVNYSEDAFSDLSSQIEAELASFAIGQFPPIIPISALSGDGVSKKGELVWYEGPILKEMIEKERSFLGGQTENDGLRIAVRGGREIFNPPGVGTVLVGAIESGEVCVNDEVVFEPYSSIMEERKSFVIKSISPALSLSSGDKVQPTPKIQARAIISMVFSDLKKPEAIRAFKKGGVIGKVSDAPQIANEIEAELIFLHPDTVYIGKEYIMYTNASYETASVSSILEESNVAYSHDKFGTVDAITKRKNESMVIRLKFHTPVCIESNPFYERMTRFVLKQNNSIVGFGRCSKIIS